MKRDLILIGVILVAISSLILASPSPLANANINVQVTVPTTYSSTSVTTTPTTITSTTTSTSSSTSKTSTTTTTTSTYTSFSYTSTTSVTSTQVSTQTFITSTQTSTSIQSTTSTRSTTSSTTSTTTSASTSTIAVFPGCLIATAVFGSELAPEVQLLRGFRDNAILKTAAGSGFMTAFNAWYYSFSPTVAGYLVTHEFERTIARGILYPLVGILKLSSMTFAATSAFPELAALLSGLVASSLIGAFYLGLPIGLIRGRIRRLRALRAEPMLGKALAIGLLSGIVALLVGELFSSPITLIVSTATIVLSALLLSAAVTSARVAGKLRIT